MYLPSINAVRNGALPSARRLARGFDVLLGLHHRHKDVGIFRQSHLCAGGRVGADRLHRQSVRQNAVMPHLVGRARRPASCPARTAHRDSRGR